MIVVLASAADRSAQGLVQRWTAQRASLMTPADLSCAGWRCLTHQPMEFRFVAGGEVHAAGELSGVLVRTPSILEEELGSIIPAERSYVAAEMNAFLVYWLSALRCPVLNRPTPRSLGGPGWYPEHWVRCAASVGLRTGIMRRSATPQGFDEPAWAQSAGPVVELTLVGGHCFGAAEPGLVEKARRLAAASGLALVGFRFEGSDATARFLSADPFPRLDDAAIEAAVLAQLAAA